MKQTQPKSLAIQSQIPEEQATKPPNFHEEPAERIGEILFPEQFPKTVSYSRKADESPEAPVMMGEDLGPYFHKK